VTPNGRIRIRSGPASRTDKRLVIIRVLHGVLGFTPYRDMKRGGRVVSYL